jgi:N-acetylneuraminate synthase
MQRTYIIAEAGVNHNGDVALARQLVQAAKAAGADAVKFQTFRTENIVTRGTGMAEYQQANVGGDASQFDMIKALELAYADFEGLQALAREIGIDFLSTPDDEESLDFLADRLELPWIKIGSGEVTNLPFLRRIAAKHKPIILSTGMSTLGEVERAVRVIRESNTQELVLLHCTTNYPCPSEEVNLRAMQTLAQAFQLRVGYSDHTLGTEVPIAAVALGACIIEKHLTLSKDMDGPDHRASMEPQEFAEMVRQLRAVEQALGTGIKWPNRSEEAIKGVVRRRIVAAADLPVGRRLAAEDLAYKRANAGLHVEYADQVVGMTLKSAVGRDAPITWDFLEVVQP